MQCLRCGREFGGKTALCPSCFSQGRVNTVEILMKREEVLRSARLRKRVLTPAGFWLRVFAWMIDVSLITILGFTVSSLFGNIEQPLGIEIQSLVTAGERGDLPGARGLWGLGAILLTWTVLGFSIGALFYILFEASKNQGTPGKIILGLLVTDAEDEKISFARSFFRYFARAIWLVPLGIAIIVLPSIGSSKMVGQIMSLFTALAVFLFILSHVMILFTEKKRALHDLLSDTYVHRDANLPFSRTVFGIGCALFLSLGVLWFRSTGDPGEILAEQWQLIRKPEVRRGVTTLPYHSRHNAPIDEASSSQSNIDFPSDPKLVASVSGKQLEFETVLAVYDPVNSLIEIGFFGSELSASDVTEIRKASSMREANTRRPHATILLQLASRDRKCDLKNMQAYMISFNKSLGGFDFPGIAKTLEFARVKTWLNSDEILGVACSLCDGDSGGATGCKDGRITGIFRDLDGKIARESGSNFKVLWDLAFQAPIVRKMAADN